MSNHSGFHHVSSTQIQGLQCFYQWIGLREIETGKPHDVHGKIDGFRFRFSTTPMVGIFYRIPNISQHFPRFSQDFPNIFPDFPNIFPDFPNIFPTFSQYFPTFSHDIARTLTLNPTRPEEALRLRCRRSDGLL